jgi:adenylylsulfate kinase-like enzyme
MTGIGSPYEPPLAPEVHLETAKLGAEECANMVLRRVAEYARTDHTDPATTRDR